MKAAYKILAIVLTLFFLGGCSAGFFGDQPAQPKDPKGKPESVGRYYDFDDVQVPRGMELDKSKSIMFNVGNLKAGVLVFSDRVEVESLINFFIDSMSRDNWRLMSSFKYPKVALFFAKKGKTCVISVSEGTLSTNVEIWVAPALKQ